MPLCRAPLLVGHRQPHPVPLRPSLLRRVSLTPFRRKLAVLAKENHISEERGLRGDTTYPIPTLALSLSLPPPTGCPDPEGGHLAARTPFTGPKAFFQLRVWKPGASLSQGAAGREAARHLLQGPCLAQAARLLSLLHISSLAFSCENPAAAVQESRFSGA